MTDLREALNHWKCAGCGGSGKYQQDAKGRARAEARGKIPDPKFQPDPVTCKVCNGDGLNPIASAALREPRDDARGELLALADSIVAHGPNVAYVSRASSQRIRNVIRDLAAALRPAPVLQCEAEPDADPISLKKQAAEELDRQATPPSRLDAGSVEARSHWAIEASIPEDGFECYYLLRDDITVAEICGHQTEQRGRHLDDLVFAANGNTPERKILASQAMEYARRLNDIAVNCEIAAFEGDASDLRRIAEWLAALVPPPSEAGREAIAQIIARFHRNSCYPEAMDEELFACADAILALSPDPGTVAVASAKPVIDPNDPNNESPN